MYKKQPFHSHSQKAIPRKGNVEQASCEARSLFPLFLSTESFGIKLEEMEPEHRND